jgi:O-antigen ligase
MRLPLNNETTTIATIRKKSWTYLWEAYFIPIGLPFFCALILGLLLAVLIVTENWFLACAMVFVMPVAILFNSYPWIAVMIWMLLIPFLPHGRVSPYIYWILHRALIPFVLILTILSRMLKLRKRQPVQLNRADLATIIYTAMAILSILMTRSSPLQLLYSFYDKPFLGLVAYWFVKLFVPGEKDLKRLIPIMLVLCLAESVIGLLAWFAPQTLPSIWIFPQQGGRTTGTLGNPAVYTSTLIFLMLFLLQYAMSQKRGIVRRFLLFTFGLGMVCIFFSFSRGSWLAGGLALFALLSLYPKPITSLILIILPIMVILSNTVLADEFAYAYERLTTEQTIESRTVLAHAGKEMFLAKPFWGWGYGNYDRYDWRFMVRVGNAAPTKWDIERGTSHNTYLTILAEMGTIGFLSYYFPFLWWLRLTIKVLPRLPKGGFWSRRLLIMMWLSVGFQLVVSQFMDMRFFIFPQTILWLTLGLIANMVQRYLEPGDVGLPQWLRQTANSSSHS